MKALRIGFLFKRPYRAGFVSIFPKAMQALAEAGVVVDVIACNERLIDLSTVRVEHDLYVLRQISGVSMSLAGALHAQGAAIVNPYPVTVADRKSTRLNSSHSQISYAVFCLKKKKKHHPTRSTFQAQRTERRRVRLHAAVAL